MTALLQRGGNISLNKVAPGLQDIAIGLGWDASSTPGTQIDLDTSAFMLADNGKVPSDEHFIFFNNVISPDSSVHHKGNNTTGLGAGDDEAIYIDLLKVVPNVQKIAFTVTIYEAEERGQHFGLVNNAFIRVVNRANREELARYNLTEKFSSETAMIFGELYRYKGDWKFRAVGQGFAGGLQAMADTFGVDTGEEAADPPPPLPSSGPTISSPTRGLKSSLDYELLYPGDFTLLKVKLKAKEMVKAESGAMVAMSNTIDVEGKLEGGVLGGLGRMLTREKFFFQSLVARRGPGEVLLAHAIPGDIEAIELDGSQSYILQKNGFLAGSGSLNVSTKMQNLTRGLFSGEGFFVIKISGQGTLFISSYGAIHPLDIPAGNEVIIDNSHLVAWPDGMNYTIEKAASGWISSFTSGEGLVCRFRGPGQVLIQTRNPSGFGAWVTQFIPKITSGSSGGGILDDITSGNF